TERDFSTDITVATLNGRTVLIDGNMPTEEVAATTGENATPAYTKYTTYVLGAGASISFKALSMISPTDAQLATSSNRELANSNESGSKTEYFPIKAIPIARIITRG
ncbi:MAG: phage coat protein, partial [Roseburia sp.]|nr:phage coat protein [Roseburia sp.]